MDNVTKNIIEYLSQIKNVQKVILFGSRARGDNKTRSDYDIAIFGNLLNSEKIRIYDYMTENLFTLLKIDCVFNSDIDNQSSFYKNIIKDGVVLYDRK